MSERKEATRKLKPPPRVAPAPSLSAATQEHPVDRWMREHDELEKAADAADVAREAASAECDRTYAAAMEAYEALSRANERYDDARAESLAAMKACDDHYRTRNPGWRP